MADVGRGWRRRRRKLVVVQRHGWAADATRGKRIEFRWSANEVPPFRMLRRQAEDAGAFLACVKAHSGHEGGEESFSRPVLVFGGQQPSPRIAGRRRRPVLLRDLLDRGRFQGLCIDKKNGTTGKRGGGQKSSTSSPRSIAQLHCT